ncbi:MAG: YigZ family protein [Firmicutes bacterium]|nr:YigZ family protein [Bacillota bacterium]
MKSVIDNNMELIIKKSKFITLTYNVNSIDDVKNTLNELNDKYSDATHICYAYIVNNEEKCSDNGEPSGTAGMPILNVLKKENLNNVLCVVVRYFGGIKLGAGGLVRAYSKACKESLKIITLEKGFLVKITFDYINESKINYQLNNSIIVEKKFENKITYLVKIKEKDLNNLNSCEIEKLREIYL